MDNTGGDSEGLGRLQRPGRQGYRGETGEDSEGLGRLPETMETRVYREQGWTTVRDWGRQRGTGETTETMETRVYREQGWMTARDCGRQ